MSMDSGIILCEAELRAIERLLFTEDGCENAAYALAGYTDRCGRLKLLSREVIPVPPDAYDVRSRYSLQVKRPFLAAVFKKAVTEGLGVIEFHSHPFSDFGVSFSGIDHATQVEMSRYMEDRGLPHAMAVFGRKSVDAICHHHGGTRSIDAVMVIGDKLDLIPTTSSGPRQETFLHQKRFSRQVSAFGKQGQQKLSDLRIAIAGAGGLGCPLAQQLAALGAGLREPLILIDDDRVDVTNLNRLPGVGPDSVGAPKVEVVGEIISKMAPEAKLIPINSSVYAEEAIEHIASSDVLFAGVDNLIAREFLSRLTAQYKIPYFDLGFEISTDANGSLERVLGQVYVTIPGQTSCPNCGGLLEWAAIAEELMTEDEREWARRRGYGTSSPAPSVVFLNGAIVSLAVGEAYNWINGYRRLVQCCFYDHLKNELRRYRPSWKPDCRTCGLESAYGRGDLSPVPEPLKSDSIALPAEFPEATVPVKEDIAGRILRRRGLRTLRKRRRLVRRKMSRYL